MPRAILAIALEIFLVTNAHIKVLDLKMKETKIGGYFDSCVTSFEMGHPKEDMRFWQKAGAMLGFESKKSLFIDDTEEILKTAHRFGIGHIVYKAKASSRRESLPSRDFLTITDFRELMP